MPTFTEEFSNDITWRTQLAVEMEPDMPVPHAATGGELIVTFPAAYYPDHLFETAYLRLFKTFGSAEWAGVCDFTLKWPTDSANPPADYNHPLADMSWGMAVYLDIGGVFSRGWFLTTFGDGSGGYTLDCTATLGALAPGYSTTVPFDPTKQHYRVSLTGTTLTFARSADGVTYTTMSQRTGVTPASGTVLLQATVQRYYNSASGFHDTPRIDVPMRVDRIQLTYTSTAVPVTATSTGQWNTARNDIRGGPSDARTRFFPA